MTFLHHLLSQATVLQSSSSEFFAENAIIKNLLNILEFNGLISYGPDHIDMQFDITSSYFHLCAMHYPYKWCMIRAEWMRFPNMQARTWVTSNNN